MGLVRTALVFGAGYALGHPAGRAKVKELGRRPEVTRLRRKAATTASDTVEAGKQQLAKAANRSATSTSGDDTARTVDPATQPAHSVAVSAPSTPRGGAGTPTTPSPAPRADKTGVPFDPAVAPTPPLPPQTSSS